MARAYSVDLRQRVLEDIDAGMSTEDAARKYSVSIAWAYSLKKQRRETGNLAPKKDKHSPKIKLEPYEKEVRQLVADSPDATLKELHEQLPNKENVTVLTLYHFLKRLKMFGAKVLYLPAYSPDFNLIEMVFSKLKQLLRKFKLRKMEELWQNYCLYQKLEDYLDLFDFVT